jgi:ATP-dependent Clp protease adaptor protein ClpS
MTTTFPDFDTVLDRRDQIVHPPKFKVIMLNDDYTPMQFVIDVLQKHFHKSHDEAEGLMWQVHEQGSALCGVYTLEVAEHKASVVIDEARRHQFPLMCVVEKE